MLAIDSVSNIKRMIAMKADRQELDRMQNNKFNKNEAHKLFKNFNNLADQCKYLLVLVYEFISLS